MYIENIKIGNFGKLQDREYDLSRGVNIIEGKNESGKTTIGEFIKFVFYGLSNKIDYTTDMSERKRHISWKSNDASGSIVINTGEKRYRIERSLLPHGSTYRDEVTVVDLANNSEVTGIKNPGEFFFGIPEEVFTHTVYVRQADGAYFNGESIGQAVENIFYSADESVNTEKALKKLDDARILLKHKKNTGRGLLDRLEKEKEDLSLRLEKAREDNSALLKKEEALRDNKIAALKNKNDIQTFSEIIRKKELYTVIEKFENVKAKSENIAKYQKGEDELITAATFNGFFPDREYAMRLESAKNELSFLKKELDSASAEYTDDFKSAISSVVAETIRKSGGRQGIANLLEGLKKKTKFFFAAGLVFTAITVLAALLAFVFAKTQMNTSLLFGGVGIVSLVLSVVCLSARTKNLKKTHKLFDIFSVENEKGLFALITKFEDEEIHKTRSAEMRAYFEKQKEIAKGNLESSIDKALLVLGEWGIRIDDRSFDGVTKAICDALSDMREIELNIAKYEKEIDKEKAAREVLTKQLQGYDQESIIQEYDSIKADLDMDIVDAKTGYDFCIMQKDALAEKISLLEKELAELRVGKEDPSELMANLSAVDMRYKELSLKYDAYVLAYEKLRSAGDSLRSRLAPGLSEVSGRLMSALTNGKYRQIGVSDKLKMTYTFEEGGTVYTKGIENVSAGTGDIAYVCLRLALAELFGKKNGKLPVVFDEAFARLDDVRLKNMLALAANFSENDAQSIIFTSQTREAEIMKDVGAFSHTIL